MIINLVVFLRLNNNDKCINDSCGSETYIGSTECHFIVRLHDLEGVLPGNVNFHF